MYIISYIRFRHSPINFITILSSLIWPFLWLRWDHWDLLLLSKISFRLHLYLQYLINYFGLISIPPHKRLARSLRAKGNWIESSFEGWIIIIKCLFYILLGLRWFYLVGFQLYLRIIHRFDSLNTPMRLLIESLKG